ncbi:MAG: SRPBCC family protein [Acidobacteria bacterium]|nr:SRPBCC family protein [Acidobacteriota bacterium]
MGRKRYWEGFITGLGIGSGATMGSWLIARALRGRQHERVVRFEKSIQIGRPIQEVFQAWSNFEQLPSHLRMIENVRVMGKRSHWVLRIDGQRVEWDAELTQRVDNQALGWKSLSGPKHSGRIDFSPIGSDTMVHVVMNYAPPMGTMGSSVAERSGVSSIIEAKIEQALRDFKAALEGKGQEGSEVERGARRLPTDVLGNQQSRATGTYGTRSDAQAPRYGTQPNPVEYTRPTEPKP